MTGRASSTVQIGHMTLRRATRTSVGLKGISVAFFKDKGYSSAYSVALTGTAERILFAVDERVGGSGSVSHLRNAVQGAKVDPQNST